MIFNKFEPIYTQIVNMIENEVLSGNLNPGDQLPSVRELSVKYQVTPNTIQKVYKILEDEEIIEKKRGLGTYIVEDDALLLRMRNKKMKKVIRNCVKNFHDLGYSFEEIEKTLKEVFEEVEHDQD